MNKNLKEELEKIFRVEQYGHPMQTRPVAQRSIGVKPSDDEDDNKYTTRDDDDDRDIEIFF
jgi:hypothetical protein